MSDDRRRLTTEEQRDRLYLARYRGGECARCGRSLGEGETVFVERFEDVHLTRVNLVTAPVGIECASDELRAIAVDGEPERCAGCGRPVYYRVESTRRGRALCSRACVHRAKQRRQAGG